VLVSFIQQFILQSIAGFEISFLYLRNSTKYKLFHEDTM
jgi:hypothetical protein